MGTVPSPGPRRRRLTLTNLGDMCAARGPSTVAVTTTKQQGKRGPWKQRWRTPLPQPQRKAAWTQVTPPHWTPRLWRVRLAALLETMRHGTCCCVPPAAWCGVNGAAHVVVVVCCDQSLGRCSSGSDTNKQRWVSASRAHCSSPRHHTVPNHSHALCTAPATAAGLRTSSNRCDVKKRSTGVS